MSKADPEYRRAWNPGMNAGHEAAFDAAAFLKTLTHKPGVYRMVDSGGGLLYVGKAHNLKRRVASYFRASGLGEKTRALMRQTHHIEVTVTHTETEALILENNLIKEGHPRYNILLRDDKGYPYLHISMEDEFPRIAYHRGPRRQPGRYFGPYPSASAARESLNLLQRVFPVRQCEDSFFRNRTRPCLQYQIKRCTAPCVGLVSRDQYHGDVQHVILFLEGKSSELIETLVARMQAAVEQLDYEQAAHCRDQIASLRRVQERQHVSGESGDLDLVACAVREGQACVQVFFVRNGQNLGNKGWFPHNTGDSEPAAVLSAFIKQYYLGRERPAEIIVSHELPDADLIGQAFAAEGRVTRLTCHVRGARARWLALARHNAEVALASRLAGRAGQLQRVESLRVALGLEHAPTRLECMDISHMQGEATVASCVSFDGEGPLKSAYRRYNIEGVTPGDDYAAIAQALTRRFAKRTEEGALLPEVLFIDGGAGQTARAAEVLRCLGLGELRIIGISKGEARRPGDEQLHSADGKAPLRLAPDSPALHLIQQIRDEAHRFAITGHRQRRARRRSESTLETIPGLGPRRRQLLLHHFGGLRELARAGVEDLARVRSISLPLAQRIYEVFHGEN
jgi:excinuclease ABC subunit C